MTAMVGIFILYLYCLNHFLGRWLTSFYEGIAGLSNNIGMVELANTINALGYQSLHGSGVFITSIVLTVITVSIVGTEFFEEVDANVN